jgi:hypothetical protein
MLRETLSATEMLNYPLFAFVLFMVTFLIVVVRVLLKRRDDAMTAVLAALPLEDDALGARPKGHAHDTDDEVSR